MSCVLGTLRNGHCNVMERFYLLDGKMIKISSKRRFRDIEKMSRKYVSALDPQHI